MQIFQPCKCNHPLSQLTHDIVDSQQQQPLSNNHSCDILSLTATSSSYFRHQNSMSHTMCHTHCICMGCMCTSHVQRTCTPQCHTHRPMHTCTPHIPICTCVHLIYTCTPHSHPYTCHIHQDTLRTLSCSLMPHIHLTILISAC